MENTYVINSDDNDLNETGRIWLRNGEVKRLSSFRSSYFRTIATAFLTSYDFDIRVWDMPDGTRNITAQIYYNAP